MSDKDQDIQIGQSDVRVIFYKLGRIESLLEDLRANQEASSALNTLQVNEAAKARTALDTRIGSLERSRSWGLGVVAAISFVVTVSMNFLKGMIIHP